jgi:hypothetical protein
MNLSLPLLFAKKIEKYVEKSVALITKCLNGSPAPNAFDVIFNIEVVLLSLILSSNVIIFTSYLLKKLKRNIIKKIYKFKE